MTAVTVTSRKEITTVPGLEIVSGTFTDGYTYSSKLSNITSVVAQSRDRAGCFASVSGRTITLNCSSASGDTFDLWVFGDL